MTKPFVTLAEVEFTDVEENGFYTSKRAQFSATSGASAPGVRMIVRSESEVTFPQADPPTAVHAS